jgi:hypothetical protein
MFGLEGSGFILSVGLTLLIAGTIIFYVNNKFKETAQQIQTVLQIVQQVNSSKNMGPEPSVTNPAPQNINGYIVKSDDLISVSDDSDISSTTSEDEPSSKVVITVDEGEIQDNKNIIVNLSHAGTHVDDVADDVADDDDDDESSDEQEDIKNVDLDNTSGTELDSMLLNIIDLHKNSPPKLQDMKVTDLRDMIKDRGLKPNNLGKLKKQECIELLS